MASTSQLWNFPNAQLIDARNAGSTEQSWQAWFAQVTRVVGGLSQAGATADRPVDSATKKVGLYVGRTYYDTDLHKPIWYDPDGIPGHIWRDATGAFV